MTLCVAWIGAFISGIGLLGSLDVAHMVTLIGWAIGCVTSWLMIETDEKMGNSVRPGCLHGEF